MPHRRTAHHQQVSLAAKCVPMLVVLLAACSRSSPPVAGGVLAVLVQHDEHSARTCTATLSKPVLHCPDSLIGAYPGPVSPDGQRMLLVVPGDSGDVLKSWSLGDSEPRYVAGPGTPIRAPQYSLDGRSVVFHGQIASRSGIWRVPSDGGPPQQLTDAAAGDFEPHDGGEHGVVFASSRDGNAEVYLRTTDGQLQRLSNTVTDDIRPRWSPDAQHLSWLADIDRNRRLLVGQVGAMRALTPSLDTDQLYFAWSPDGASLALIERTGSALSLVVRDLSGQALATLDDNADAVQPTWSPDGRAIAWTTRTAPIQVRIAAADGSGSAVSLAMSDAAVWLPRWLDEPR